MLYEVITHVYLLALGFLISHMTPVSPGGRKLTELVSDHVFVDENWNVLTTVMNHNGQADKIRKDRNNFV